MDHSTSDPSLRYDREMACKHLHEEINKLSDNYRTTLTLSLNGATIFEIAEKMGCEKGNVYNYIKNGKNSLRDHITGNKALYDELMEEYDIAC